MANRAEEYSAGLMTECSWFLEFKKIVFLKFEGVSDEEIKRRCLEDNLFGMPNEHRIKTSYNYIIKRVRSLDSEMIELFCNSDLATQKIINLITVLRGDRMFFEFINEVYREKNILGYTELSASDANTFFRDKSTTSEELLKWRDTTFPKLRSCYFTFMKDANLLRVEKRHYYITPPILDIALERYLQYNGEERLLKAITGVN